MRYYHLEIGGVILEKQPLGEIDNPIERSSGTSIVSSEGGKLVLESSPSNRAPLNIEFNIKSFSGGAAAIPGFIKIYNPPRDWFIKTRSTFVGKNIELKAGFEDSIFTRNLGYSKVTDDLLMSGTITNILGDYSSRTPYMLFYFSPDTKKQQIQKIQNTQTSQLTVNIPPQSVLTSFIVEAVKFFTDWIVTPWATLASIAPSAVTITFTVGSLAELLVVLNNKFNIESAVDPSRRSITLYKKDDKDQPTTNSVSLKGNDLISQPEVIDQSLSISALFRLRGDLRLGSVINLQGVIPSVAGLASAQNFIGSAPDLDNVFRLGNYRIVSVEHTGDFHNLSVEGWSTAIRAVPHGQEGLSKILGG